ncbi:hypothetical protein ABW20_dc0105064 [Dactylellina cionopaga]|nr:hypothetical protein ABW20_dc0105064 [Dactylellina cionopaga]
MGLYVRTLTISDLDKILELENACFSEEERGTPEKFRYRLNVCGELSHGLFTLSKPHPDTPKGVSDFKPREILVAMISATKTTTIHVTDASMNIPKDLLAKFGASAQPQPQSSSEPAKGAEATQTKPTTEPSQSAAEPDASSKTTEPAAKESPPPEGHVESGDTVCIHSLCVSPSYRNHGYSQILMKDFIARMRDAGVSKRISLVCRKEMTGVYTKVQFRYRGKSSVSHGGGEWVDMTYEYNTPPTKAAARRG